MINPQTPIGRVIGTETTPNTAYTFHFWASVGNEPLKVGIGSIVKVESGDEVIYGTVVEAFGFNDVESPMYAMLGSAGDPGATAATKRPEVRLFKVAVLRRIPEEPIGAVPMGTVYLADNEGVQAALHSDSYAEESGIPCGYYGAEAQPVHLDSNFLLGFEAGHMNITGTSGLATKTSYLLFLLQSIFTHLKEPEDAPGERGVAALLFNTKGADLLYLDKRPEKSELSAQDAELFAATGIEPGPFEKVQYFAPFQAGRPNSVRDNEELYPPKPFSFGLVEALRHMEVLLGKEDLDGKISAYLEYLNEKYVVAGEAQTIETLTTIVNDHRRALEAHQDSRNSNSSKFDSYDAPSISQFPGLTTHHAATVAKAHRRLSNLGRRFKGVIAEAKEAEGPFSRGFRYEDRTVYVVDVAQLSPEEQELVFAAAVTYLREAMQDQKLGVGRLIVAVDELNKYAPSGSGDTYISRALRDIAARGRYMGLILFGAQQFRSRVDREIVGNAATHAFGHIETEELSQSGYSYLSGSIKEKLSTLERGNLLIKHPYFSQPIFIRFPKPFIMTGGEGMRRFSRNQTNLREACARLIRTSTFPDIQGMLDLLGKVKNESLPELVYQLEHGEKSPEAYLRALRATPKVADAGAVARIASNNSLPATGVEIKF